MSPDKVDRNQLEKLTDLPNIGTAIAADLRLLGIDEPDDLAGQSPFELYNMLSSIKSKPQDPCLLDVLISITRFMDGEDPRPWWHYTAERKRVFGHHPETL